MDFDKESLRNLALATTAVTEVVVITIMGVAIGYFLDRWIKITSPWLTVLFTLIGLVGGFYRLYQVMSRPDKRNDNNDN